MVEDDGYITDAMDMNVSHLQETGRQGSLDMLQSVVSERVDTT